MIRTGFRDGRKTSPHAKRHKLSLHVISLHFYIFSNLFSYYQWKANTIHIQKSNKPLFPFISLHFPPSLLLSIEKQLKNNKYITTGKTS